jgi:hypothetical protein
VSLGLYDRIGVGYSTYRRPDRRVAARILAALGWRRPSTYLDAGARGAISTFTKLADVAPGLWRLRTDLADGTWERRHAPLLALSQLDIGYRLIIASKDRERPQIDCAGP